VVESLLVVKNWSVRVCMQHLFYFVEADERCEMTDERSYMLLCYPRNVIARSRCEDDWSRTLGSLGMGKRMKLFVEEIAEKDDDEDDDDDAFSDDSDEDSC